LKNFSLQFQWPVKGRCPGTYNAAKVLWLTRESENCQKTDSLFFKLNCGKRLFSFQISRTVRFRY